MTVRSAGRPRLELMQSHTNLFCYLNRQTIGFLLPDYCARRMAKSALAPSLPIWLGLSEKGGKRFLPFLEAKWGSGGRWFKSTHPDSLFLALPGLQNGVNSIFFCVPRHSRTTEGTQGNPWGQSVARKTELTPFPWYCHAGNEDVLIAHKKARPADMVGLR